MTSQSRRADVSTWRIFRGPLSVNVIGLVGLVVALLGDGWLDAVSWICLGGTVLLMFFFYLHGGLNHFDG